MKGVVHMAIKNFAVVLIAAAALAAGFYLGRSSRNPDSEQEAGHAGEPPHEHEEESRAAEGGLLTLSADAREKFDIQLVEVQPRSMGRTIEMTGTVGANESRRAHIRPLARGRIHEVYVQLGDHVRAGQPLLQYDNVELGEAQGEYVAALAEIEKSRSETEVARRSFERARSLVELGAIAAAELQKREAEFRNSMAETERRKARAALIEEKLHRFGMTDAEIQKLGPDAKADYHRESSHNVLRAPFNGVITEFNAAPGETIDPEDQVMLITDLSVVWVQADVYEKDLRLVREGTMAEVRVEAQPGRVFPGKITYVGDVLDPQTRTAKVRVEVDNPDRLLRLEMFAMVRIPTQERRAALMIPLESVHEIDRQTVAFVKRPEGFEQRSVNLGERADGWIEIIGGLSKGEQVVTEGSFLLKSEAMKSQMGGHEH